MEEVIANNIKLFVNSSRIECFICDSIECISMWRLFLNESKNHNFYIRDIYLTDFYVEKNHHRYMNTV